MATQKTKTKDERTRNWCFVVYPEGETTLPKEWRFILDSYKVPWVESPRHDADKHGDDSEKKPHIHICVMFEGKKSFEQVKEITDRLNSPIPQKVASMRGLIRYFVHMDDPDKAQYSVNDIKCHRGADVEQYLTMSASYQTEMIKDMLDFIDDNNINEIQDLIRYARHNNNDWFNILAYKSTFFINTYIKSRRHRVHIVDAETGEVINEYDESE